MQSFLIGNALFWFDKHHIDGLQVVDAVASILYLDYARKRGATDSESLWEGRRIWKVWLSCGENEQVYGAYPDVMMIAEESTAWPMVSRPASTCRRLGFGPQVEHGLDARHAGLYVKGSGLPRLSPRQNYIPLAVRLLGKSRTRLSRNDAKVYGKGSADRHVTGGCQWQKFANLRLLYGYMFGHPGKKLLFMGGEIGQWSEWNHDSSLDWGLLQHPYHAGLRRWVRDLNTFYRGQPSLFELDFDSPGFEWVDCGDSQRSVVCFLRNGKNPGDKTLFVCNFTPVPRHNYRVGVPLNCHWREMPETAMRCIYGGSGQGNEGGVDAAPSAGPRPPLFLELDVASVRCRDFPARGAKCLLTRSQRVPGKNLDFRPIRSGTKTRCCTNCMYAHSYDSNDDGIGDLPGTDPEARLSSGSGRHLPVAPAVLSFAVEG